jgi:hypothetical protein
MPLPSFSSGSWNDDGSRADSKSTDETMTEKHSDPKEKHDADS